MNGTHLNIQQQESLFNIVCIPGCCRIITQIPETIIHNLAKNRWYIFNWNG